MEIVFSEKINVRLLPKNATAKTFVVYVRVNDIHEHASSLLNTLCDDSWVKKLDIVAQSTFQATVSRTIDKLTQIFREVNDEVTSEFGEYMVSMSAGKGLNTLYQHKVFPISELWKAKTSGNEGFDFHTETQEQLITFGEAKYKKSQTPYSQAARQVNDFIKSFKDNGDAILLREFASKEAIDNLTNKRRRGFCIAFSLHADDCKKVLHNAVASELVQDLSTKCDELYIIGVEA